MFYLPFAFLRLGTRNAQSFVSFAALVVFFSLAEKAINGPILFFDLLPHKNRAISKLLDSILLYNLFIKHFVDLSIAKNGPFISMLGGPMFSMAIETLHKPRFEKFQVRFGLLRGLEGNGMGWEGIGRLGVAYAEEEVRGGRMGIFGGFEQALRKTFTSDIIRH